MHTIEASWTPVWHELKRNQIGAGHANGYQRISRRHAEKKQNSLRLILFTVGGDVPGILDAPSIPLQLPRHLVHARCQTTGA